MTLSPEPHRPHLMTKIRVNLLHFEAKLNCKCGQSLSISTRISGTLYATKT
jgi:hypothetical protein